MSKKSRKRRKNKERAPDLAGGGVKATVEVEAVQIVEEKPSRPVPPPLPGQRSTAGPSAASEQPAVPPPLGKLVSGSEPAAESATADGLSELQAALEPGTADGQADSASAESKAPTAAEGFAKKLTAEAEAVAGGDQAGESTAPQQVDDGEDERPAAEPEVAAKPEVAAEPEAAEPEAAAESAGDSAAAEQAAAAPDSLSCYLQAEGIPWHKLDFREAGLLAQVDGKRDREGVIAAAGLDAESGSEVFDSLLERGLILKTNE